LSGQYQSHTYIDNGIFTATLAANDGHLTDTKSVLVTIANVAPTVTVPPSGVIDAGGTFILNGSFNDPGPADGPWPYTVDWGDASAVTAGNAAAQGAISASHVYGNVGQRAIVLSVGDKDHQFGSASLHLTVSAPPNAPPQVISSGGPYSGTEGIAITVNGLGSDPEDGSSVHYQWDFGDATPLASGRSATHAYADNASYRVTLVVIDSKGAESSPATATASITNIAPTATFSAPGSTDEGSGFILSLNNPVDAPGDLPTLNYAFDCGDGNGLSTFSSSVSRACPTRDNGSRSVSGRVRDKDGGVTGYTRTVSVLNVPPAVTITSPPATISARATFNLQFRFTDPGVVDNPWFYQIIWGDGSNNTGPAAVATQGATITQPHSYKRVGTYTVRVRVLDKNLGLGVSTVQVVVR
jgi:PKD repeat protein